ncbi:NRDE family protein [Actinospica durhamensis]|uniref:NRDE family protein n=1 Tax=Actinospica durhamensis TaxID=1508375 RepID=UPI001FE2A559|nr:NRDE family protein [Actinospica durhamensis]
MCTVVLSLDPNSPVPVLLIGVRDEFLDRAWLGPRRHWPQWPDLVGGRDLLAGGTWLAVDSAAPRAACVLNGHGKPAAAETRLSRGELPLTLAARGAEPDLDLDRVVDVERHDPFHLVYATSDSARLWSWDGVELVDRALDPGLHLVVNSGLEGADDGLEGPGVQRMRARIDHFRPLLAAADRPRPRSGPAPAAWAGWLPLADGDGLDPDDSRALLVRADFEGRAWGSSSISLVALSRGHVRYDFRAVQGDAGEWTTVLDSTPSAGR